MTPKQDGALTALQLAYAQLQHQLDEQRAESETAHAREVALAEVLDVIKRSMSDPVPVFDAVLDKASRLCGAASGQLAIYDGGHFRFVAVHGDADFAHEQLGRGFLPPSFDITWPRIVAGEHTVHLADAKNTELYRAGHDSAQRTVDVDGVGSLIAVALRKDGRLLGALTIYRQQAGPFSDKQIALLLIFAAQAVIAIENARLLSEQREALEQQTATAEVLQVINASPGNVAPVFEAIIEKATRFCDPAFGLVPHGTGSATIG